MQPPENPKVKHTFFAFRGNFQIKIELCAPPLNSAEIDLYYGHLEAKGYTGCSYLDDATPATKGTPQQGELGFSQPPPSNGSAEAPPSQTMICPEHHVEMKLRVSKDNPNQKWYSHKISGTNDWCNQKPKAS